MSNNASNDNRNSSKPTSDTSVQKLRRYSLYRHPVRGWSVISNARDYQIQQGTIAMPELAGQTVTVATAFVKQNDDRAWLLRLERGQWPFDAKGFVDQDLVFAEIQRLLDVEHDVSDRKFDEAEIDAIKVALRAARPRSGSSDHSTTAELTHEEQARTPLPPTPTVAEFLRERIDNCNRSQNEISDMCGFKRPNMISMLKTGRTAVPLNKIQPLARALDLDPLDLFRRVYGEYQSEVLRFFDEMVARQVAATSKG